MAIGWNRARTAIFVGLSLSLGACQRVGESGAGVVTSASGSATPSTRPSSAVSVTDTRRPEVSEVPAAWAKGADTLAVAATSEAWGRPALRARDKGTVLELSYENKGPTSGETLLSTARRWFERAPDVLGVQLSGVVVTFARSGRFGAVFQSHTLNRVVQRYGYHYPCNVVIDRLEDYDFVVVEEGCKPDGRASASVCHAALKNAGKAPASVELELRFEAQNLSDARLPKTQLLAPAPIPPGATGTATVRVDGEPMRQRFDYLLGKRGVTVGHEAGRREAESAFQLLVSLEEYGLMPRGVDANAFGAEPKGLRLGRGSESMMRTTGACRWSELFAICAQHASWWSEWEMSAPSDAMAGTEAREQLFREVRSKLDAFERIVGRRPRIRVGDFEM